ncbi:hypothetical protein Tco_0294783 [Tanacetum coccineum]
MSLTCNTPYPLRKIRRICAYTSPNYHEELKINMSYPEEIYTPYPKYSGRRFWKILNDSPESARVNLHGYKEIDFLSVRFELLTSALKDCYPCNKQIAFVRLSVLSKDLALQLNVELPTPPNWASNSETAGMKLLTKLEKKFDVHQRWEHHKSNHQPRLALDLLHLHHSCWDTHVLKYRGVQMRRSVADLREMEYRSQQKDCYMGTPQKQPSTPFAIGSAAPASFLFGYACSRMPGFEGDGI